MREPTIKGEKKITRQKKIDEDEDDHHNWEEKKENKGKKDIENQRDIKD